MNEVCVLLSSLEKNNKMLPNPGLVNQSQSSATPWGQNLINWTSPIANSSDTNLLHSKVTTNFGAMQSTWARILMPKHARSREKAWRCPRLSPSYRDTPIANQTVGWWGAHLLTKQGSPLVKNILETPTPGTSPKYCRTTRRRPAIQWEAYREVSLSSSLWRHRGTAIQMGVCCRTHWRCI